MKKILIVTTAGAVFAALSPAFADQDPYARAYNTENIDWNRGGPYRTDTTTGAVECFVSGKLVPCVSNAQSAAPAPKRQRHARH
jgi:hypothetical protein